MDNGFFAIVFMFAMLFGIVSFFKLVSRFAVKDPYPYEAVEDFVSPSERSFYGVLCNAVSDDQIVLAKVRLADLVRVKKGYRGKRFWMYFNKISGKHVDFVICNAGTLIPVCVVELDDKSHKKSDRRDRDHFVDKVMERAGIKIVHVPCRQSYSLSEIQNLLS